MQAKILAFIAKLTLYTAALFGQQYLDRPSFYGAMGSGQPDKIEKELQVIAKSTFHGKAAFEGTLMMKKAGLINGADKKLKLFKSGRIKLEGEIAKDSLNAEYRFLRLMIEEHAPGIVKYRSDLVRDRSLILNSFQSLDNDTQLAIISYSKKSKVLKPGEF